MADAKLNIFINAKDNASGVFGGIKSALGNIFTTAAGFVSAQVFTRIADGIASVGKTIMAEAMDAQKSQAQLNAVLKSTGQVAGVTADMANKLASSLSGVTTFSDDAILAGESMLLTFTNIGKDVFPATTEVMLDMSAALGQDLKSSAMQLGKALNDPLEGINALTRVGVKFSDATKRQIERMVRMGDVAGAQKLILAELQTEFGGSAKAAGETFAGKLDILKNKLLNVAEGIGTDLLPIAETLMNTFLIPAAEKVEKLAGGFSEFAKKLQTVIQFIAGGGSLSNIGGIIGYLFGPETQAQVEGIMEFFQPIIDAVGGLLGVIGADMPMIQGYLQDMFDFLIETWNVVGPVVINSIAGAINTITEIWAAHGESIMATISFAWNFIVATIGGILVLLGGIIQAGVLIIQGIMDTFSLIFQGKWSEAWVAVQTAAAAVWAVLSEAFNTFMNLILSIVGTNLEAFKATWQANWNMLVTITTTVANNIVAKIKGFVNAFKQAGIELMEGLRQGMIERFEWVIQNARQLMDKLKSVVMGILGIHSPSSVFEEYGKMLMTGMERGINENAFRPTLATAAAAQAVAAGPNLTLNATVNTPIDLELLLDQLVDRARWRQ